MAQELVADAKVYAQIAAYIAAGVAIAIGTLGPTIGQGMIGSKGCESIGKYPESANKIQTAMFLGLAMVETSALFAFLTVILLIFFAAR
jgi:F-type H+-transporting ATPase subunit c